eukprot:superscaffoldBa00010030_g24463
MLLDGYPLELLDGDASNIPERWVTDMLTELHKKLTQNFEKMWTEATKNVSGLKERDIAACVLEQLNKSFLNRNVNEDLQNIGDLKEKGKYYVKGFGGKFGVQTDRQDKSALGWDHQEKLQLHESQKDYKRGFGGQYGVEMEKQDQCALGYEHKESLAKHESQKGT